MINKFQIYSERCSGSTYLKEMILNNFKVKHTNEYGHKHFFGFNDLSNSDDTLFICLVRNPYNWLNSLYIKPYHFIKPCEYVKGSLPNCGVDDFLNHETWCKDDLFKKWDKKTENLKDRNIYTKERYKNLFELRYTKIRFMKEDLPKQVKNYIFIRYEDLLNDYTNTIKKIKNCGLIVKENIKFPVNNTRIDFKHGGIVEKNKKMLIDAYKIFLHKDYNKEIEEDTLLYTPTQQFKKSLANFIVSKNKKNK